MFDNESVYQELFKKVVPYHCLGSVWGRRSDKKYATPPVSVYATVEHFNAISYRVVATIVKQPFSETIDRPAILEKWIEVAQVGGCIAVIFIRFCYVTFSE